VLLVLMRRRLGRIEFGEIADSIGRIVGASALVAGAAYGGWYGLDRALGRSVAGQLVSVGVSLATATGVYLLASRALKVRELGALLALRRRLQRDET
jgi:hypothetical protein